MTFSTLLANMVPNVWNFFWNMKEIFLVTKDKHSSCFSRSVPLLKSLHYFHDLNNSLSSTVIYTTSISKFDAASSQEFQTATLNR